MGRRQRMNMYFEPGLLKRVKALAERRKVSKSAVIEAAVLSLVSGEDDGRRDAALSKRLDRLGRRIDDVDEAVVVLGAAFALYARSWMTHQLPILANENEAAKKRGADMYARFNEALVRRLAREQRFLNERVRDIAGRMEADNSHKASPTPKGHAHSLHDPAHIRASRPFRSFPPGHQQRNQGLLRIAPVACVFKVVPAILRTDDFRPGHQVHSDFRSGKDRVS